MKLSEDDYLVQKCHAALREWVAAREEFKWWFDARFPHAAHVAEWHLRKKR